MLCTATSLRPACYVTHAVLCQDGGMHVEVAHPQLAAGLDLAAYRSDIYERVSIQSCAPKAAAAQPRLGMVFPRSAYLLEGLLALPR